MSIDNIIVAQLPHLECILLLPASLVSFRRRMALSMALSLSLFCSSFFSSLPTRILG
jgi:hypothetical protein